MGALDSMAMCPYFGRERDHTIRCEAGSIRFKDSEMKKELGYRYCARDWNQCQLKQALDHYYDRNEKKESRQ